MKLVDLPAEVFTSFVLKHVSLDDVMAMIRSGPLLARYVRDALRSLQLDPPTDFPKNRIVVAALELSQEGRLFSQLPDVLLRVFVHYVLVNMQSNDGGTGRAASMRNSFLRYVRFLCL